MKRFDPEYFYKAGEVEAAEAEVHAETEAYFGIDAWLEHLWNNGMV